MEIPEATLKILKKSGKEGDGLTSFSTFLKLKNLFATLVGQVSFYKAGLINQAPPAREKQPVPFLVNERGRA